MPKLDGLHQKYDFKWEVLDVLISGRSMIDFNFGLSGFPMQSQADAERFLRSYGYDIEDPIQNAEIIGTLHESINFIRKYFLAPENPDGLKLEIPRKILEVQDFRDLLLMASLCYPAQTNDSQGIYLQNWACSILKVVHTLAHIDKDLRTPYFSEIQKQIFDRFYKVIHRDEKGGLFLGETLEDPLSVRLVAFDTKPKKPRDSILLKLLHKPENVADEIFDRVGMRFVTETLMDAVRVLKYLKDQMIVMPANIKPSRSRNSLVDIPIFKRKIKESLPLVLEGQMNEEEFHQKIGQEARAQEAGGSGDNPHSSQFYRAIQFTSRQLIKLKNPLHNEIRELKGLIKNTNIDQDLQRRIDSIDLKYIQREVRFFYPFEVQIMDQQSLKENEEGQSAHSEYKKAQIQTALKRVMGGLMDVAR